MTIAQAIVTYAVCWWMVLFMVLPFGVAPESKPGEGHAPSAPANPRLRRKFKITTLLAIIPAVLIYIVATQAKAEDVIYHVGSDCHGLEKYTPSADLNVKDGEGIGGKTVAPATLGGGFDASAFDSVEIPLEVPAQNYLDRAGTSKHNVDLSHSFIEGGKLTVNKDGEALLNGKSITDTTVSTEGCGNEN